MSENKMIGQLDAKKRMVKTRNKSREQDFSTEETFEDGSVRGRSVEYVDYVSKEGEPYTIKHVVRYWSKMKMDYYG
jgi:hypothetical protein